MNKCLGLMIVGLLGFAAQGDIRVTLVDDAFARRDVSLSSIQDGTLTFSEGDAKQTLPMTRLAWLDRDAPIADPGQANAKFVLRLRDGQRWSGTPGDIAGDALAWNGALLGPQTVLLKDIAQIIAADAKVHGGTDTPIQDELHLTNGDLISGVISSGDAKTLVCQTADGQSITVDWANIRHVRLAAAGAPTTRTPAARVELRDGAVLLADAVSMTNDSLLLKVAGTTASMKAADLVALEPLAGSVRLLNRVPPTSSTFAPYFPRVSDSQEINESAASLQVAGVRTRSFLIARPKSEIHFALDGSAARFHTRYAIADDKPLADVTVRVLLDGKVVHERQHVRTGSISEAIDVPLGDAKRLTLESDFGETYDVQDELYWVEPALLAK